MWEHILSRWGYFGIALGTFAEGEALATAGVALTACRGEDVGAVEDLSESTLSFVASRVFSSYSAHCLILRQARHIIVHPQCP
jgi:hypothetical protein